MTCRKDNFEMWLGKDVTPTKLDAMQDVRVQTDIAEHPDPKVGTTKDGLILEAKGSKEKRSDAKMEEEGGRERAHQS